MFLIDTNVWLALTFTSHLHHPTAKHWFDNSAASPCVFCRVTQMGFLRLATNPKAFPLDAVTMSQAWAIYDGIVADPRVVYTDEPPGVEMLWRRNTSGHVFSPKVWNDAYLAAFAEVANMEIVTFDHGFKMFGAVKSTILP